MVSELGIEVSNMIYSLCYATTLQLPTRVAVISVDHMELDGLRGVDVTVF